MILIIVSTRRVNIKVIKHGNIQSVNEQEKTDSIPICFIIYNKNKIDFELKRYRL